MIRNQISWFSVFDWCQWNYQTIYLKSITLQLGTKLWKTLYISISVQSRSILYPITYYIFILLLVCQIFTWSISSQEIGIGSWRELCYFDALEPVNYAWAWTYILSESPNIHLVYWILWSIRKCNKLFVKYTYTCIINYFHLRDLKNILIQEPRKW